MTLPPIDPTELPSQGRGPYHRLQEAVDRIEVQVHSRHAWRFCVSSPRLEPRQPLRPGRDRPPERAPLAAFQRWVTGQTSGFPCRYFKQEWRNAVIQRPDRNPPKTDLVVVEILPDGRERLLVSQKSLAEGPLRHRLAEGEVRS